MGIDKKFVFGMFFFLGILLIGGVIALTTETIEQNLIVNIIAGEITINSPENITYNTRIIPINVSLTSEAKILAFSDNGKRFRTLCRNCDSYGLDRLRRRIFSNGFHNVTFLALFDTGSISKSVQFFVDARKPRILRLEPRRGDVNGSFHIEFREENPKNLYLTCGTEENDFKVHEIDIEKECHLDRLRYQCDTFIDLSEFNGEEIRCWVNITDIAGNKDISRPTSFLADTTSPEMTVYEPEEGLVYDRRVPFNITISEDVTLEYIDYNDRRPRWRRLCSRCDEYGFERERTKSFRDGERNITIKATDKASNVDEVKEIVFTVV